MQRVLDIWGFIGESALYLSQYNKEIYCYELSQKNFAYLQKNCANKGNIYIFNVGVTIGHDEYIEYNEDTDVESTTKIQSSSSKNSILVKNINILDLIKSKSFDGFKLDIEWWEYDIIKSYLIIINLSFVNES